MTEKPTPQPQLSVFEVELGSKEATAMFQEKSTNMIDQEDDQIRLCRFTQEAPGQRLVYGARRIEERVDYWII